MLSSQPYPWPYHGAFDGARAALVACIDGRWRAQAQASDASDARLREVAVALRRRGGLIIAITATPPSARSQLGRPDGAAAAAAGLHADIELRAGATNAFYSSALEEVLRTQGRNDLLLAGWGLEGPVHSTMRAANDRGYECLLVPDACTPIQPDLAFAACEMVRFSGGIFGAFADSARVVEFLAQAPPNEELK